MPASLLTSDSPAASAVRDLLTTSRWESGDPGLAQARILAEYILGRRSGELDVSGRGTEAALSATETFATQPEQVILIDDPIGVQAQLLRQLTGLNTYHDRIDEARRTATRLAEVGPASTAPAVSVIQSLRASVPTIEAGESSAAAASARWAIVNAPKAGAALAETIAGLHGRVNQMIVIGRSDAMSRVINKELARAFGRVDVSPGVGKHRMIIGSRPLAHAELRHFPQSGTIDHPAVGKLQVRAHGGCFSGIQNDEGSALLLQAVADRLQGATVRSILDLGVGNGWLLSAAMRVTGAVQGVGVDVSRAAVASAQETTAANGVDATILLADLGSSEKSPEREPLEGEPPQEESPDKAPTSDTSAPQVDIVSGAYDLILLNPPFHQGTSMETQTAEAMMASAAQHLAPGGHVFVVFNSHLRHRQAIERIIGPVEQVARNRKFTVLEVRG